MSVKHMILALLTQEEIHGYDLKLKYDQIMLRETELNFGQVYTTLTRLERDGLVQPRETENTDKKVYAITPLGREELRRWLLEPAQESPVLYDGLSYKLAAMQVLGPEEFLQIVQQYKKELTLQMQRLTRKKLETDSQQLGARLLLERGILKLEADILWADRCLEELRKAGVQEYA